MTRHTVASSAPSPPSRRIPRGWSLQPKAWAITVSVLLIIGLLIALSVDLVVQRSLREIEDRWVADTVHRTQSAQALAVDGLERACRDYANWSETYHFIDDPSLPYLENNLIPSMFANLQLDAVILFYRDGRTRLGRSYDGEAVSENGINDFAAALRPLAIQAASGSGHPIKGLLRIGPDLALVAVLPILLDDGSGPPNGALAEIRFLNTRRLAAMRDLLDLDLTLRPLVGEPSGAPAGIQPAAVLPDALPAVQVQPTDTTIEIQIAARDVQGQTVGQWTLRLARQIHAHGVQVRRLIYVMIGLIALAASLIVGVLIRRLVIARVEVLDRAVQRIRSTSDLSVRLPVNGSDEIAQLTDGVNQMLDALAHAEKSREQLHANLLEVQKLEAISTLAGGLAHDFNNVITSIQGSASLLRMEGTLAPPLEQHLARIERSTQQAARLVRQMMTIGRRGPAACAEVSLGAVVKESLGLVRSSIPRGIKFEVLNSAQRDLVWADAGQLQQVLVNLATNSSHAMAGGTGTLTVEILSATLPDPRQPETKSAAPGPYLRLVIRDTGCGIAPEHLPHVFEAFYTTKPAGSGTGLGLAVAHGVVNDHRGTITIESQVGRGTAVIIHLPTPEVQSRAPAALAPAPRASNKLHLLLVDDDTAVRDTLVAAASRLGYEVTAAESGPTALRLFDAAPNGFDAVLTDQLMPGMTGSELGQLIARRAPALPLIMITGYAQALNEAAVRALGFRAMLMKPVTLQDLKKTLDAVLRVPTS